LFSGYILKDLYVGFGSVFFDNAIFILPINFLGFDIEFIPLIFKLIPTIFTMVVFYYHFCLTLNNVKTAHIETLKGM